MPEFTFEEATQPAHAGGASFTWEEATQPEDAGAEFVPPEFEREAHPPAKPAGFFTSLGRSFTEPIKATGKGLGIEVLSDETLQNALSREHARVAEDEEPTLAGKAGNILGGLAGTLAQAVPIGAKAGLPGIVAQFGLSGQYEAFLHAGKRALDEGRSLEEATDIGKHAARVGGIAQAAAGLVMGGGGSGVKAIAKEAARGAVGMGGAQLAQNVGERQFGLQTPLMEGVPEAAAMGGLLPPGIHLAGMGFRALSRRGRTARTAGTPEDLTQSAASAEKGPDAIQEPEAASLPLQPAPGDSAALAAGERGAEGAAPLRAPQPDEEAPAVGKAPAKPGTVLHVFPNVEDGTEATVVQHVKGFAVVLRDTDSGQTLPTIRIFPEEAQAVQYAKTVKTEASQPGPSQGATNANAGESKPEAGAGVKESLTAAPTQAKGGDSHAQEEKRQKENELRKQVLAVPAAGADKVPPPAKEALPAPAPVAEARKQWNSPEDEKLWPALNQQLKYAERMGVPVAGIRQYVTDYEGRADVGQLPTAKDTLYALNLAIAEHQRRAPSDFQKELTALIASNLDGQAKARAVQAFSKKHGLTVKAAQEMVEAEIVRMAHNAMSAPDLSPEMKQRWARLAYDRQPTLSARTSTSVENQAYSTPIPLAQALGHAIGVDRTTPVYEPTAGNGMLMIGADLAGSHANEIEPGRVEALKKLGVGTVTNNDATKYTPTGKFPKVLANPPFGGMPSQPYGGYGISRLEHLISLKALEAMEHDGQAAIILGAKREPGEPGESGKGAQWVFENYLYGHYNVIGNFEVAGDLYSKQGASWPVRVLVIDGRRTQPIGGELAPKDVARFNNWDDVWKEAERLRNEIERRRQTVGAKPGTPVRPPTPAEATGQPGTVPGVPDRLTPTTRGGGKPRGAGGRKPQGGERPANEPAATPPVQPLSRPEDEPTPAAKPGGGGGAVPPVEAGGPRPAEPAANAPGAGARGGAKPDAGKLPGPIPLERPAGNLEGLSEAELDSLLDDAAKPAKPAAAATPAPAPTTLTRSPEGKRQPTPTPPAKTASDIIAEAAKAGVKGADEALKGLHDLFGGGKHTLSGMPVFDEETYAKAKPHFDAAYESFKQSGKSLKEFFSFIFQRFGESVKPYLKKFVQDLQAKDREPAPAPPTNLPQVAATEHQVNYEPRSKATPFGTLTPRSSASGVHESLDKLQARVGPIDEFVANRLNMGADEVRKVMAAEQVDGVALAIDQIENGGALIIGDETGIGKGRQGAAVIRYAILQGKIPIFFTKDPKLFTDMYGDLLDIHTEVKPFILGDPGKASIVDTEGNRLHRAPGADRQKEEMGRILGEGLEASGYSAIFVTYSQVNVRNSRQAFLENLAQNQDTILIMDEAHEAAGDGKTSMQTAFMTGGNIVRGSGAERTTTSVPGLLRAPGTQKGRGGVVYLSATYAKRSENMPVYFRTSLSKASDSFIKIVDAMKKGGVALQQAVSEALSAAGQYVRRERDFTGVSYGMKPIKVADEAALVEHVDQVTDVLSEIVEFSHRIADVVAGATAQSDASLSMTDFAAIVHNQVGQLLLATKADAVVEEAIAAHARGEKPVIALMNTMESFLGHFADDHGIKPGQKITLRWNELLKHALKRTLRVSEKLANGDTEITEANPGDYGLQEAYDRVVALAEAVESKFPVSPIDYIIQKLAKAGVKMAELTGRESGIEYTNPENGEGIYRRFKRANKNAVVNGFNDDTYNGMLLNASGSTGLSAHASVKFKAQQPRHMIIAQPALDINVFVQTLGRIKRTGMVKLGTDEKGQPYGAKYSHLVLPLQAELRPAAMAARKMKSLNANTTAETNNAIKIEAEDLFNKYGDQIVAEYLNENRELQLQTGIPIGEKEDGSVEVPKDVARKFTGRMALRPDAEQKLAYEHILGAYRDKIEQLRSTGEYDLEVVLHDDWDGKQQSDAELSPGTDESNIFTASTRVQQWEIRDSRHVPTGDEIQKEYLRRGGKDKIDTQWRESQDSIEKALESRMQKVFDNQSKATTDNERTYYTDQMARLVEMKNRWDNTRRIVGDVMDLAGQVVEMRNSETGEVYYGALVETKLPSGMSTGPSNFKMRFAVESPGGVIHLNAGDLVMQKWTVERSDRGFTDLVGAKPGSRANRFFITGNPIRGFEATGGRGKIVRFKAADGSTVTGLLMPANWEPDKLVKDPRTELVNGKAAEHFLQTHANLTGYSRESIPIEADGRVRIQRSYGEYSISVPAARRTGGDVYLDPALRALIDGGDFTKRGLKMVAELPAENLVQAIDRIMAVTSTRFKPVGKAEQLIPRVQDSNQKGGGVKPSDVANALADKLQGLKSPQKNVQLFGVLPAVWNAAIDLATGLVRAGGKVADAVAQALEYIRAHHKGAWDEAGATAHLQGAMGSEGSEPEASGPTTTRVMGQDMQIGSRPGSTAATDARAIARQQEILRVAGLDIHTTAGPRGTVRFTPDPAGPLDAEGRKLTEAIQAELPATWNAEHPEEDPTPLTPLFQSIRAAWGDGSLEATFGAPLAERLFNIVQAPISHWGVLLQSLQRFGDSLIQIAHNPLAHLRYEWSKMYGGSHVEGVMDRAMQDLIDRLGPDVASMFDPASPSYNPDMAGFFEAAQDRTRRDTMGRIARRFQQMMEPKQAKRLSTLANNADVQELVQSLIEEAAAKGTLPKLRPGKKRLTPLETLLQMASEGHQAKADELLGGAIRQGERAAAREAVGKRANAEEMDAYDARTRDPEQEGPDPTPEEVRDGLANPKYSHWSSVREMLGYSPVTLDLAQQVLRGDFKGLKFKPTPAKAAEMRIDLAKLAVSPESEVARVLNAWHDALAEQMASATPETALRIREMMEKELVGQLERLRKQVRDPLFAEKVKRGALTPEEVMLQKIHAGLFGDARLDIPGMVERVASKSAVNKLLPNLSETVKRILSTPVFKQEEYKTRFLSELVNKLGIDPAQADKAWAVFERAFGAKFEAAKARAAEKAAKDLLPAERAVFKGKGLIEKLQRNIRAGNFDGMDLLSEIARLSGERVPAASDLAKLKSLGERLERLRQLDATETAELRRFGTSEAGMEKARQEKSAKSEKGLQPSIEREMAALWSGMSRPLTLRSLASRRGWVNMRDASREFVVLNLLSKIGHVTRFPIHLATQVATHFGSRPLAVAFQQAAEQGNVMASWGGIARAYQQQWQGFSRGLLPSWLGGRSKGSSPAWVGGRAEALGRGEGRNVDGLMESMQTFGRMEAQAQKYLAGGNYPMYVITKLLGLPAYAGRWISVVDQWQGNPAVYGDILHQTELEMTKAGWTEPEKLALRGKLLSTMTDEIEQAILETGLTLHASGETVTDRQIEENAWGLVRFRLHELLRNAGLPADAMAQTSEALRRQLAWQDQVKRGVGAPVALALQTAGRIFPPLGAFSNAIGHGLNWTVAKLPPGLHLAADVDLLSPWKGKAEPSNFFRTATDKKQRLIESIGVTMGGALIGGLIMNRFAQYNPFLTTAEERAEMAREGRKPGTVDFILPDGSKSTWSLIVGPMTLFAPWIAGFGATSNLQRRRERQQAALEADATRRGVPAGNIREISAGEWAGVAGQAALTAILGSKTAGGWTTQFTDPNQGFAAKRTVAQQVAPFVPGLPGYQEISRMMGVSLAQNRASVWDYLVPLPSSGARALNVLGDPVGTRDDLQRVVEVLTGGSYPLPHRQEEAYQVLANSGYHPPAVSPNKGYEVNGVFRPLNDAELAKFTENRGKSFKAALAGLGPNPDREAVKAAFQGAEEEALASVGAGKAKAATRQNVPYGTNAGAAGRSVRSAKRIKASAGRLSRSRLRTRSAGRIKGLSRSKGRRVAV